MDTYVCSFSVTSGLIEKSIVCFCYTPTELSTVIVRAENAGYGLIAVTKLSNCYDFRSFLKFLEPPKGKDLLFGKGK